jgi:dTDP-4-dehydrorhamnose reductase
LPGVFHVVSAGEGVTYEEFVREALAAGNCQPTNLEVVSMNSLNRPAPRPRNGRLRCLLSEALQLTPLRHWREGLYEFTNAPVELNR